VLIPIPPWENGESPALVGVSGGRDSVALLHAMVEGGWRKLIVCHFDHGLREESAQDARFVAELAKRFGCEALVERSDVAAHAAACGQSIETAARELRYRFFARCAQTSGTANLFLAHHADDQVETFLFRLLRGTGVSGLEAMRSVSQHSIGGTRLRVFRPFLSTWREDIDAYIAEHALPFREDPSNTDLLHTRNRLRHDLLPALEAAMGRDVRRALWRAAEIVRAENEFFAQLPELRDEPPAELSVENLQKLPLALQRRLIHGWLRAQGVPEVGWQEVENVRGLIEHLRPAKTNLPGNWHARRRAGKLFLSPSAAPRATPAAG
jgi:tRNA(Ile)-lysidine synthase